jgi:hypothetical protein
MALAQRGLAGGGTIQTASHLGSPGVDARNGHGSAYLHGRHPRDRARCAGQRGRRGAGDVHHGSATQQERHCCWYGTSGAGKGYSLRVVLSRERFANGLRVYG